mgnify:FL=1
MKASYLHTLIDDCVTTGEYLKGLQDAMYHSHQSLDSTALESCFALLRYLSELHANQQGEILKACQQLDIVNNAVNGGGA